MHLFLFSKEIFQNSLKVSPKDFLFVQTGEKITHGSLTFME